MTFDHGGDWAGYYAGHGVLPLDFSASVSPLGLPRGVREAVACAMDQADRYPDPFCRALRKAIGVAWDVSPKHILCGNGAGDLIERVVQAVRPRRALVTAPTFSEYPAALRRAGCQVREHPLQEENGFHLTETFLSEITTDVDLVFLCEPNNPTGVTTAPDLLEEILERCDKQGALLIADECFNGLLSCPGEHTLQPFLEGHRLLLLNAFTKLYALAGLRLGFAFCADRDLLEGLRRSGQPWPVSALAQAAGIAALEDKEYPILLRRLLDEERPKLKKALAQLGAETLTGEANFVLFRHADLELAEKLEERGILIRRCVGYSGLGPNWYRVAVRTMAENGKLLEEMRRVIP